MELATDDWSLSTFLYLVVPSLLIPIYCVYVNFTGTSACGILLLPYIMGIFSLFSAEQCYD